MTIAEHSSKRLVLKSGSTALTLDKDEGKAILQRKVLMFNKKPYEVALRDVAGVTVDVAVDRASGIEVCSTVLTTNTGGGIAVPARDKKDAEESAAAVQKFLGLKS